MSTANQFGAVRVAKQGIEHDVPARIESGIADPLERLLLPLPDRQHKVDVLPRVDHLPLDLLSRPVPNGRAPGDLYAALDALVTRESGSK